jgi:hypothetical protein
MTVVPLSHASKSTFKSDVTVLATYAKQPVGAADGGPLLTSAKRFRKFLELSPSRLGKCCARSQHLPSAERYPVPLGVMLIAMTLALVTGCGSSGSVTPPVAIAGSVQGGHGPVSGASIQLYAASSGGLGSAATPLLQKAVASDSNGNFSIPTGYSCPSPSSAVYVVASGGSTSSTSGENSALMLTAMLGPCSGLAALGSVSVNEVTTVGSVWPLAHYFTSRLISVPRRMTLPSPAQSPASRNSSILRKEALPAHPRLPVPSQKTTSSTVSLTFLRPVSAPPVAKLAMAAPAANCFRWPVRQAAVPRPIR